MAIPVVLDCDPGHDDAFAIWLAAGHPNLRLLGITTVGGNGRLVHTTHNARVVCTVAGIKDVPIAAGSDSPLVRALSPAADIHGENALGGPELPEPRVDLDPRGAFGLLRETISGSAEPVTVLATGPLTNIALLLRLYPDLAPKIAQIAWMGGSTGRGNVTPYAEFNAWVDPEAAAVVFASGVPVSMVGLNVTHQALVTPEVLDQLGAVGNATSSFAVELLKFFRDTYQRAEGMVAPPLHDPVAVALVAEPEVVRTVPTRVDVELHGRETAGATSVDLHNKLRRPTNARVALDLDAPRFWAMVEDALRRMR